MLTPESLEGLTGKPVTNVILLVLSLPRGGLKVGTSGVGATITWLVMQSLQD